MAEKLYIAAGRYQFSFQFASRPAWPNLRRLDFVGLGVTQTARRVQLPSSLGCSPQKRGRQNYKHKKLS